MSLLNGICWQDNNETTWFLWRQHSQCHRLIKWHQQRTMFLFSVFWSMSHCDIRVDSNAPCRLYFKNDGACGIAVVRELFPVFFFFSTLIREPKKNVAYSTSEFKRNTLLPNILFLWLFLQHFITPFLCSTLEYSVSRPLSPPWVLLMTIESDTWQQSSKLTVLLSWKNLHVWVCAWVCVCRCVCRCVQACVCV